MQSVALAVQGRAFGITQDPRRLKSVGIEQLLPAMFAPLYRFRGRFRAGLLKAHNLRRQRDLISHTIAFAKGGCPGQDRTWGAERRVAFHNRGSTIHTRPEMWHVWVGAIHTRPASPILQSVNPEQ